MSKRIEWVNAAGERRCAGCETYMAPELFNKGGPHAPGGLYRYCKACQARKDRAWYERNKAQAKAKAEAWRKAHPEQSRASHRVASRVWQMNRKLAREAREQREP